MLDKYPSHGGDLIWAKEYYQQKSLIDFSVNINPLGCSKNVLHSITNNLTLIQEYPDPECRLLKKELSLYYNINDEHISLGNGASELLFLLCLAISPKRVLTLAPSFSEYIKSAKASGALVDELVLSEKKDFCLEIDVLKDKLLNYDLFFLCNPNNPVGNIYSGKFVKEIADLCYKYKTYLLVDESFMDFVKNKDKFSILSEVRYNPYLIVLCSLTKFFALPGLRLGCSFASKELVERIKEIKDPWNVNSFAQLAGMVSLQDKAFQNKSIDYISTEKERLYQELNKISSIKTYYPSVNFILLKILTQNLTSGDIALQLATKGILVRNCNTFAGLGEKFIRVAVRRKEDNNLLIDALRGVFKAGGKSD
jgi:threonine-phosphate decarboxylase